MAGEVVFSIYCLVFKNVHTLDLRFLTQLDFWFPGKHALYDQMWAVSSAISWGNIFMKRLHPADAKQTQMKRQAGKDS